MNLDKFFCPNCERSFTAFQAVQAGGVCPSCGKMIKKIKRQAGRSTPQQVRPHIQNEFVTLKITPVKGEQKEVAAITQLLNALGGSAAPFVFEISGTSRRRHLIVRCRRESVNSIKGQVIGIYGSPEIIELEHKEDPASQFEQCRYSATQRLQLAKPAGLPLRTYRELEGHDTILPVLSALYDLEEGEVGMTQLVIRGAAPPGWADPYRKELLRIKRRQQGLLTGDQLWRMIAMAVGIGFGAFGLTFFYISNLVIGIVLELIAVLLLSFGVKLFWSSDIEWSETQEEMVMEKIRMPAYGVELRLAAASNDQVRVRRIIQNLKGAYNIVSLEAGNSLRAVPLTQSGPFSPSNFSSHKDAESLLGDQEIATLWHLPICEDPDLVSVKRGVHTLPDAAAVSPDNGALFIGEAKKSAGLPIPVYLPREAVTRTHCLLMGRTRMGKTTLLERIAFAAMSDPNRSVVVIDPHDDMVTNLLGLVPPERIGQVQFINFGDQEMKPAINPLDVGIFDGDPEVTTETFMEVAHTLFARFWGPRMEAVMSKAVMAIAIANSIRDPNAQFTIKDTLTLLILDNNARTAFLNSFLPEGHLMTDVIKRYFALEYNVIQKSFREQIVQPVLSKLRHFETNSYILTVFAQPKWSFNIVSSVLEGKIILIQTGATLLSKEFSSFVGSYLLNMVRKTIYLQGGKPPSERRPVTIFIDESQRIQGADYGLMLAEIAKFGGNVILTTQGMDSIGRATASDEMDDPQAFSKIMDNTDTLFVFRMSGVNAKKMADTDFWGETTPTDLINLDKYHAFVRFSKKRSVQGPFEVALAAPLEPNETTRTRILSLRGNYLKTREQADISARESLSQVEDYYFKGEKAMFTNIEPPDIIKEKVDAVKSVNEIGSAIQTVDIQPDEIEDMLSALGEINIAPAHGKN